MKFTGALLVLSVVLPLLVSAAPTRDSIDTRETQSDVFRRAGRGGNRNKNNNNNNSNNNQNGGSAAGATATSSVAAAAATGAAVSSANVQTSPTLDPSVICSNFANDGQNSPAVGQVASLTSTDNFINFCKGKTLTNGQQVTGGSCNPAPMGDIPANTNMPGAKFVVPKLLQNFGVNARFEVVMNIQRMVTGRFVNAEANFFAAPQQLQSGVILGHSHVVIQSFNGVDDTSSQDPRFFAFFKGLNAPANNGQLTVTVDKGLAAGFYRICSINTAANHQPVLVPVAQHGSLDDCTYFTVGDAAKRAALSAIGASTAGAAAAPPAASSAAAAPPAASSAAAAPPAASSAAAGNGGAGNAGAAKGAVSATVTAKLAGASGAAGKNKNGQRRRSFDISRLNQ